jgi:hypothetical protein
LVAGAVLGVGPGAAFADDRPADYAIENGRFYRQAAGAAGQTGRGFRVTDDDGVPFWSELERLGGPDALGYPISRRFYLDGFLCQATQRAILQWRPAEARVELLNVMEYLSRLGADRQLAERRFVPPPAPPVADPVRQSWLRLDTRIESVYSGASDPLAVFGLPLSPPQRIGPAVAMRFQRGVIYAWSTPQAWAGPGQVSVANVGDFVKDVNGLPAAALEPEDPPPVRQLQAAVDRGGPRPDGRLSGVATYYGDELQGEPMANGDRFDMWDPTIAASNSHPLGTRLRVTRLATGQSIVVRVTDRGGFRYPIVVDLSYAAFCRLADPDDGAIRVTVDPLD